MAFYHTTPNQTKLYVGSGRVYIADVVSDVGSAVWQELGTMSALAVTAKLATAQPSAVNGQHKKVVTEEGATVSFSMQEIDAENMKKCTGGLTTIEYITAASVSLTDETAWTLAANTVTIGKFVAFNNQSHSGTGGAIAVPTSIVVKQGETTLTLNTDYEVVQDDKGYWGLIFKSGDGVSFDTAAATAITYTYTPIGKTVIHQGGKVTTDDKMVKVVNEQSDGRRIETIYYLCEFTEGGALNLKTDGAADLIDFNVTLEARNDTSRPVGSQLYEMAFIG